MSNTAYCPLKMKILLHVHALVEALPESPAGLGYIQELLDEKMIEYASLDELNGRPEFSHSFKTTSKGKRYIDHIMELPFDVPEPQQDMGEPRKPRWTLLDFDFIDEMAFNMEDGLRDGRQPGDWKNAVEADPDTYLDKLLRHARSMKYSMQSEREAAAVACNAMILGYLCRKNASVLNMQELVGNMGKPFAGVKIKGAGRE